MAYTAKITSKGQITIPRAIRKTLEGNVVEFQVTEGKVVLKAVKSVGGALRAYSKGPGVFSQIRDKVWGEVVDEKAKK